MRLRTICLLVTARALAAAALAAGPAPAGGREFPLETYASVGSVFARNSRLADLGLTEEQFAAFLEGVRAEFRGRPYATDERTQALHDEIGRRLREAGKREAHPPAEPVADAARMHDDMKEIARQLNLQFSDSGLAFGLVSRGGRSRPGPEDTVVVTYEVFSVYGDRELPELAGRRRRIKVMELLPGLAEGVQMMTEEGSALFVLPPALSYGAGDWPRGVERGTPLLVNMVLHEVVAAP